MNLNNLSNAHKEIKAMLHDFYLHMQEENVEGVFEMFSPNLQQLTIMEQHSEKYQRAFRFGRKICWMNLYSLTEIKSNLLEGVVMLCLVKQGAKLSPKTKKYKESDNVYSAFKIQFIYLNEFWFIDDIFIYNELWSNEFKNELAEELSSQN